MMDFKVLIYDVVFSSVTTKNTTTWYALRVFHLFWESDPISLVKTPPMAEGTFLRVNALKLRVLFFFTSDPAQVHMCIYWGIVTLATDGRLHWRDSGEKFCYVLLHLLNGAVKVISAGKRKTEIREMTIRGGFWWFILPFEGYAICSNQKPLKIPPNVINIEWWPVEFLYIANHRVHKGQRFLWWHRTDSWDSSISVTKNTMWLKYHPSVWL